MTTLDSPQNPRLRELARLRDRRDRGRSGLILVDGVREISRALVAGLQVEQLIVCESLCTGDESRRVIGAASAQGIPRLDVSPRAFEKLAYGDRGDGLIAVARPPRIGLADLNPPAEPLLVILEGVEKPGNLGAILRSADGSGSDGLIVADPVVDLFNPNVIRASLGVIFSLPVAAATAAEVITWLTERQIRIVAARVDGPRLHTETDLRGPLAIVLGSEANGLTEQWHGANVSAMRLPMLGSADSLNVSAAAAVLLYEARRQRQA